MTALHHARGFRFRRNPPVRRELIDELRQISRQALEQLVVAHAGLPGERIELFTPEGFFQIGRRYLLVRPAVDPGLGRSSLPAVRQIVDQTAKTAAQHAACSSTAKERSQQPAGQRSAAAWPRVARSTTEQAAENVCQTTPTGISRRDGAGGRTGHGSCLTARSARSARLTAKVLGGLEGEQSQKSHGDG